MDKERKKRAAAFCIGLSIIHATTSKTNAFTKERHEVLVIDSGGSMLVFENFLDLPVVDNPFIYEPPKNWITDGLPKKHRFKKKRK